MMRFLARVERWGRSLIVRLPDEVVHRVGVRPGNTLELNVRIPRKSYLGALRGIQAFIESDRNEHTL